MGKLKASTIPESVKWSFEGTGIVSESKMITHDDYPDDLEDMLKYSTGISRVTPRVTNVDVLVKMVGWLVADLPPDRRDAFMKEFYDDEPPF